MGSSASSHKDKDESGEAGVDGNNSNSNHGNEYTKSAESSTIKGDAKRLHAENNDDKGKYKGHTGELDEEARYDSADSDDTFTLAERMIKYVENVDDCPENTHNEQDPADINEANSDVDEDDLIEQIAQENMATVGNPYDIDTIGYYIVCGRNRRDGTDTDVVKSEEDDDVDEVDDRAKDDNKATVEANDEHKYTSMDKKHDVFENQERFDMFRKIYGRKMSKSKRPSLANNQTLVLAKIGSQYKYIAVPAYLPGQKLVKTKSISNKGFIERAKYVNKVIPVKKRKSLCLLLHLFAVWYLHICIFRLPTWTFVFV